MTALRILIVEDDLLIAVDLASMLDELGHEACGQAADAAVAVERAGLLRPDLVLMDVRLAGGTSGVDAAAQILRRHGVRSLFVSGNVDAALVERTRPLDPVGHVGKPADLAKLGRALAAFAGGEAGGTEAGPASSTRARRR